MNGSEPGLERHWHSFNTVTIIIAFLAMTFGGLQWRSAEKQRGEGDELRLLVESQKRELDRVSKKLIDPERVAKTEQQISDLFKHLPTNGISNEPKNTLNLILQSDGKVFSIDPKSNIDAELLFPLSGDEQKAVIIGHWKEFRGIGELEFNEDHTMIVSHNGERVRGKYKITSNNIMDVYGARFEGPDTVFRLFTNDLWIGTNRFVRIK